MTEKPSTRNAMSNKTQEIVGNFEARLPELPKFNLKSLSDLPSFKLPSSPSLPDVSSWEIPSIPSSPSIRMPGAMNMPSSPSIPKFSAWKTPSIKTPTLPGVQRPSLPQMPSSDSLLGSISGVSSAVQSTQDLAQNTVQSALDLGISTIRWVAAGMLLAAALAVADTEDMGLLDPYERVRTRAMARLLRASDDVNVNLRMNLATLKRAAVGSEDNNTTADAEDAKVDAAENDAKKTLPVIHPVVDGRLKDVSKV